MQYLDIGTNIGAILTPFFSNNNHWPYLTNFPDDKTICSSWYKKIKEERNR